MNKKILLCLSLIGVFCSFVCPHVYAKGKVVPIFYKNIDAVSISEEQAEDSGTKFLVWLFSPNYGNRYSDYEEAIGQMMETIDDASLEDSAGDVIVEIDDTAVDEAVDKCYEPIADIVSSDMIDTMKKNRLPFSYDEAIEESEVTVTVSDVTFSDGTTSSFTDGAIFDYDVILEIDGSESFADVSYISLENDGQYHIKGQITVLDNQITGLYISR